MLVITVLIMMDFVGLWKQQYSFCEGIKRFLGAAIWDKSINLHPHSNFTTMKRMYLKTVAVILLNLLFCAVTIYLFCTECFMRPFAGSLLREAVCALLFLGPLYVNYFLLYPKVYRKSYTLYWVSVALMAIAFGFLDLAIAYPFIMLVNGPVIRQLGFYKAFSTFLFFITGRNLAFNFFPFLFREKQHYRQSLEKEVQVVCRDVRKLDVIDKDSNVLLVNIDDIFYCQQLGNYTSIYTVQNERYTRLGSMRHLEQVLGEEEFIRITSTMMVSLRYIESFHDNQVVMRKMPWEQERTVFQLEPPTDEAVSKRIAETLRKYRTEASGEISPEKPEESPVKRKPSTPPEEKWQEVLAYVETHPNCGSADIIAGTGFSLSTVERCLAELKKQGVIEYAGSKKTGGYRRV